MASSAAARVREATDLVELIGEVTAVTRAGGAAKALCPFHPDKDTPSLSIDPEKGVYHCFGCQAGGDALTFVQQHHGVDFPEALGLLAKRSGVDLGPSTARRSRTDQIATIRWQAAECYHELLRSDPAAAGSRAYLRRSHGFGSADVSAFTVGWAPQDPSVVTGHLRAAGVSGRDIAAAGVARLGLARGGRVVYPVVTGPERVAGFAVEDSAGRFYHAPKGDRLLYGLGQARSAIAREGAAVVVSDFPSLIAWHRAGLRNTVAPAAALNTEHLGILARFGSRAVVVSSSNDATRALLDNTPSVRGLDLYVGQARPSDGSLTQEAATAAVRSAIPIPEARLTMALDGYRTAPTSAVRRAKLAAARAVIDTETDDQTRWELASVAAAVTGMPMEYVMGSATLPDPPAATPTLASAGLLL